MTRTRTRTRISSKCQQTAAASWSLQPPASSLPDIEPQQPGPLPAQLPGPPQPTASSACPSSQDLCQPSYRDHHSRQPPQPAPAARTSASPATGTTAADSHLSLPCSPQPPPASKWYNQPACLSYFLASRTLPPRVSQALCSHRIPRQSSSLQPRSQVPQGEAILKELLPSASQPVRFYRGKPSSRSFPPSASQPVISLEASLLLHSARPSGSLPLPVTDSVSFSYWASVSSRSSTPMFYPVFHPC